MSAHGALIRLVMARDWKPLRRDLVANVQARWSMHGLTAHPLLNADPRRRP
jgi:hypothetical protein